VGSVATSNAIVVNLGARSARSSCSHLCECAEEISVTRDDVVLLDAEVEPEVLGLEIGRQSEAAFEVGNVKAVGGEAVDLGEELPGEPSSLVL
jgi:hypothetical protein